MYLRPESLYKHNTLLGIPGFVLTANTIIAGKCNSQEVFQTRGKDISV